MGQRILRVGNTQFSFQLCFGKIRLCASLSRIKLRYWKTNMDEESYFCKHCNGSIESLNDAGDHKCFRGKEHIYQDEKMLYVHNYKNKSKQNHEEQVYDNEKSEVPLLSSYTEYIESDEDLSQSADFQTESNSKKSAVWTKQATIALLSIYEANIQRLTDMGIKSAVWKKISEGLKDLSIQVTADQVKWKFNRLFNKYKECINNNESGRPYMTFEYYEQFDEIFNKKQNTSSSSSFSSSLLTRNKKKRNIQIIGSKNISKNKKLKINTICSENNPPVDDSPKLKTTPNADKQTERNQQRIIEILEKIQESQKSRDEKMTTYLKMKEMDIDLKKKAIDIREAELQVKRDVASEKLKLNQKKHKDWLDMEKLKCELLKKLVNNRTDTEESTNK